jgi:hypothetical protein
MSWQSRVYPCGSIENTTLIFFRISLRSSGTTGAWWGEILRTSGLLPWRILATCRARLQAKLYRHMAFPVF